MLLRILTLLLSALIWGCSHDENMLADLDLQVGKRSGHGISITVDRGLAAVTSLEPGTITLWAQSPVLNIRASTSGGPAVQWKVTVNNCMPDMEISASTPEEGDLLPLREQSGDTSVSWTMNIQGGRDVIMEAAPPDGEAEDNFSFAVISDIQGSVNGDMYSMIKADSSLRFVVSAGDLTENGTDREFISFKKNLTALGIPLYSTAGNHDTMNGDPMVWHRQIGRFSMQFRFKGVYFTFADSSEASIEPAVYTLLKGWISGAGNKTHVFVTHYPPFDPFGYRGGSFSSAGEAARLLAILGRGGVDLTLYGHVHMYYSYSNAGIPAYISGGGGGIQGIISPYGRHYLTVETDSSGISRVRKVMVH